jgi:hypothetical protein
MAKYELPKFDYYNAKVVIERPTRMHFVATGTCNDRDFHPERAWVYDNFENRIETIASMKELEDYINGWANEVLLVHERSGCIATPMISIATGEYTFRI